MGYDFAIKLIHLIHYFITFEIGKMRRERGWNGMGWCRSIVVDGHTNIEEEKKHIEKRTGWSEERMSPASTQTENETDVTVTWLGHNGMT